MPVNKTDLTIIGRPADSAPTKRALVSDVVRLANAGDVALSNPVPTGAVLKYNGAVWADAPGGGTDLATTAAVGVVRVGPGLAVNTAGLLRSKLFTETTLYVSPTGTASPASPLPVADGGAAQPFALLSQALAWAKTNLLPYYRGSLLSIEVGSGVYTELAPVEWAETGIELYIIGGGKTTTRIQYTGTELAFLSSYGNLSLADITITALNSAGFAVWSGAGTSFSLARSDVASGGGIWNDEHVTWAVYGQCVLTGYAVFDGASVFFKDGTARLTISAGAGSSSAVEFRGASAISYPLTGVGPFFALTGTNRNVYVTGKTSLIPTDTQVWSGSPIFSYKFAQPPGPRLQQVVLNVSPAGTANPTSPLDSANGGLGEPFALLSQAINFMKATSSITGGRIVIAAGVYNEPAPISTSDVNGMLVIEGGGGTTTVLAYAGTGTFFTLAGNVRISNLTLRAVAAGNLLFLNESASVRFAATTFEGQSINLGTSVARLTGVNTMNLTGELNISGQLQFADTSRLVLNSTSGGRAINFFGYGGFSLVNSSQLGAFELTGSNRNIGVGSAGGLNTDARYWTGDPVFIYNLPQPIRDANLIAGGGITISPAGSGGTRLLTVALAGPPIVYITQGDYTALPVKDQTVRYVLIPT